MGSTWAPISRTSSREEELKWDIGFFVADDAEVKEPLKRKKWEYTNLLTAGFEGALESQEIYGVYAAMYEWAEKNGYVPKLYMECGRYPTGPHGVLVASVINRMSKYREYVGVDVATMSGNPRPAIYDAYHHITILGPDGMPKTGEEEVVDVVGPLCENSD